MTAQRLGGQTDPAAIGYSKLPGRAGCREKGRERWEVRPLVSRSKGNRQTETRDMDEREARGQERDEPQSHTRQMAQQGARDTVNRT